MITTPNSPVTITWAPTDRAIVRQVANHLDTSFSALVRASVAAEIQRLAERSGDAELMELAAQHAEVRRYRQ